MEKQQKTRPAHKNSVDFFQRRPVRAAVGLIALAFAYLFALRSLDVGNLFDYLLTLVFIVIALREFTGATRRQRL